MIRLTYTPCLKDYQHVDWRIFYRQRIVWIVATLSLVFILLFLARPFLQDSLVTLMNSLSNGPKLNQPQIEYKDGWPLLIVPAIFLMTNLMHPRAAKKRWDNAPELRAKKDFLFDNEGVHCSGEGFSGCLGWNFVVLAEYSNGWFYLKTAQELFYFFPRSVVPDPNALAAFLTAKVKKTKGLSKV